MTKENEMPRQYYTADSMLRYNPLWAMILGERSTGKSFEFKKRSINTPDSLWVYLRRTDSLRKDPKNWKSYLSDLLQNSAIDLDAEYKVSSEGIWVDGIQKVIFSALSTDSTAHSMNYLPDSMQQQVIVEGKETGKRKKKDKTSFKTQADLLAYQQEQNVKEGENLINPTEVERIDNAIQEVEEETKTPAKTIKKKIVFEEMLEPKNRYLRNEVELLMEFYVTVDRYTNTQLFGIANLMTSYNPYFEYFGIRPFSEEFKWFKNKTLLVQNVKLAGMEEFVKKQRFYNLIEGTAYADYLTNNTPWQDDSYALEVRPPDSTCRFNIRMNGKLYGVWEKEDMYYISEKNNPQLTTYSGLKSMQDSDLPIKKNEILFKMLNTGIENNLLKFESIPVRDMCFDLLNGGYREG